MEENERDSSLIWGGAARRMPTKDPRLARRLEESYRAELSATASYTYRSMMTEPISKELSDALDQIAVDEMEHFRLLGLLIVSLGGNPTLCTSVHTDRMELNTEDERKLSVSVTCMLSDAIREERAEIDRYQTLMARTQDRIVRSFLCQMIADEERHVARLYSMITL